MIFCCSPIPCCCVEALLFSDCVMIGSLARGCGYGRRLQSIQQRPFFSEVMAFISPKVTLEPLKVFQGQDDQMIKSLGSFCDSEYGGGSESSHEFLTEEGQEGQEGAAPFLRWKGRMNFTEQHILSTKASGGFCALKIDYKKAIDLLDYRGLEISLRTRKDMRIFVNLRFSTYIEDDMYQVCLDLKGEKEWKCVFTPFGVYQLTSNGNSKEQLMENDHLQVSLFMLLCSYAYVHIVLLSYCLTVFLSPSMHTIILSYYLIVF
jgi:hypothetical protein